MSALRLASEIRCGVTAGGRTRDDVLRTCRRAEAAGFHSLWAGDHLAFHVPIPESLTLLSFAAAATERITLGTSVYLLPLRPPAWAAKVAATLDVLSGGRLVLGVGVGGEFPPEFEAAGVPVGERGARTDEAIPLLRRLWTEDAVEHRGRHFDFGPVSLDPKPLQPGGPPIWIGGRKAPALRRAGRLADGYISHMATAEHYAANLALMRQHAEASPNPERPFGTAAFLFTLIHDDREAAIERAAAVLGRMYRTDFRDAAPRYCLLGRPDDCLEQVERFVAAGARHFILAPLGDPTETLERAASDLLPTLHKLRPPAAEQ